VYMVWTKVPFFDPALLLLRQSLEQFPQVLPKFPVKHLPAALRNENHMVLAFLFCVA
jgi:hypothetical protein